MKQNYKSILVILLLLLTIGSIYAIPQVQYRGKNFITSIKFPLIFAGWNGRDVTDSLNINIQEARFNFINDAVAREYFDSRGNNLIFIVLDAGNFHNPKVCFTSSGYEIEELNKTEFVVSNRTINAHTLYTKRDGHKSLSFYWIVIDKKIANEWIEQKLKQLYFSMLNKEMVGLMVRLDIPLEGKSTEDALILAKQFVNDLNQSLQPNDVDYIFGQK